MESNMKSKSLEEKIIHFEQQCDYFSEGTVKLQYEFYDGCRVFSIKILDEEVELITIRPCDEIDSFCFYNKDNVENFSIKFWKFCFDLYKAFKSRD